MKGRGLRWLAIGATCAVLIVPVAAAQPPAPPRPAVGPPPSFAPPPRVERTLPNGLLMVAARYPTVPKVIVTLTIRAGLAADPPAQAGLAQLVAGAVQEGTSRRTSEQIKDEVFGLGAVLSAAVGQDSTSLQIRGPSETLPQLLDLLGDLVQHPTFPAAEVDLLKVTAAQQLRAQLASPQFVNARVFRRALFGDHPYGRVGATLESLAAIDRGALAAYHQRHYRPDNAFLIVVGDVAPEEVLAAAERTFGAWPRGAASRLPPREPPTLEGRRLVFVHRPGSVQSSIAVGNLTIARADARWHALQLANLIYGGAFDSRLVRNIREDKGYTYSPGSLFQAMAHAGLYRAVADVRNEVTGAALREIYREIDLLRREGPRADELADAKTYARGVFLIQNATQTGLAGTLNTALTFGLGAEYPERYQQAIAEPSVEMVRAGARVLLGSADSLVVVVGDYAQVREQLRDFSDIVFVDVDGNPVPEPK